MTAPGIDVVVTNYRTPADLADFLTSLEGWQPECPWTATVVNVDPLITDVEVAAEWKARHPTNTSVVTYGHNAGYARACNRGAQGGTNAVIALFNADVRLTPGALDECVEALLSEPSWAVLGPRQVDDDGRLTAAGIFGINEAPAHRGWHEQDRGQYVDVRDDAVTVAGSAYFVRRDTWEALRICPLFAQTSDPSPEGGFLLTPHYFEETFCSYHARAHGYRVVYYGPTTIVHRWHRASVVGGWAEQQFKVSQGLFRAACKRHGIAHD